MKSRGPASRRCKHRGGGGDSFQNSGRTCDRHPLGPGEPPPPGFSARAPSPKAFPEHFPTRADTASGDDVRWVLGGVPPGSACPARGRGGAAPRPRPARAAPGLAARSADGAEALKLVRREERPPPPGSPRAGAPGPFPTPRRATPRPWGRELHVGPAGRHHRRQGATPTQPRPHSGFWAPGWARRDPAGGGSACGRHGLRRGGPARGSRKCRRRDAAL